ncbi:hypothetical protein BMS3Abin03_01444 [bacterium BMS3Abin03]|nr:hypothetical protein BMS3Abin03_01444 [bacterium BMS3Abin03]
MQKYIIITGIFLIATGLLWPVIIKLPFGKLPGDIIIDRPNMKIYIPITTMLLISVLASIVLWIIRKISG